MTTANAVREIIAEHTSPAVAPADLQNDALLVDLGLDDFDLIEAVMDLEDALNIEISDSAREAFKTVADVVDFCDKSKVTQ